MPAASWIVSEYSSSAIGYAVPTDGTRKKPSALSGALATHPSVDRPGASRRITLCRDSTLAVGAMAEVSTCASTSKCARMSELTAILPGSRLSSTPDGRDGAMCLTSAVVSDYG